MTSLIGIQHGVPKVSDITRPWLRGRILRKRRRSRTLGIQRHGDTETTEKARKDSERLGNRQADTIV